MDYMDSRSRATPAKPFARREILRLCALSSAAIVVVAVGGCGGVEPSRAPMAVDTAPTGIPPAPTSGPSPAAAATSPVVVAPSLSLAVASPSPTGESTASEPTNPARTSSFADLAVVRGETPEAIVRAAVDAIGGISRFVPMGSKVVVKPNVCVSSAPEYAATTNPEVVAALVRLCKEAGAAQVKVLDNGFGGQRTSYAASGIGAAVAEAGGEMVAITPIKWKATALPGGKAARSVDVFEDVLTADVLINVPIAKTHNLATLTLGMKNLMGTIKTREPFHGSLGQSLSDLMTVVKPTFTLVDAVRILTRGGPQGGRLEYVKKLDTVIASTDVVAADAYASTLFGMKPDALETVRTGAINGHGTYKLDGIKIAEIQK